jgi:hypothetical protein
MRTLIDGDNLLPDLSLPGTGGVNLPAGPTAQRKTGALDGAFRYSTDLITFEGLVNGSWQQFVLGSSNLVACALRRTTTLALTTTATDITFNTVDYANNTNVLVQGATTSQLIAKVAGLYLVILETEDINTTTANLNLFQIKVNGTAVPNGLITTNTRSAREHSTKVIPLYLNANDYITVAASSNTGTSGTLQIGCTLSALSLTGAQGPAGVAGGQSTSLFSAAQFDNPNNSNWAVTVLAPVIADTTNAGILVRAFDDTAEEGIGFTLNVPAGATNLILNLTGKCATAPATAKVVLPRLFTRAIPMNAAVGSWSAGLILSALNIPTNAYYQAFQQTISLASLGMSAGSIYQLEFTRQGSNVADTLVGDFHLLNATVSYS